MIDIDVNVYLDVMDLLDHGTDLEKDAEDCIRAGDDWFFESVGRDIENYAEELGLDPDAASEYFYGLEPEKIIAYINIDKSGACFDYEESEACNDRRVCAVAVPVRFNEVAFINDNRAGIECMARENEGGERE